MRSEQEIPIFTNPGKEILGQDAIQFLRNLGRTSWIDIKGVDESRSRVITTLLHGNEPSGLLSLHRWLLTNPRPVTNICVLIGAVDTALELPIFAHRMLPHQRDFNRCFRAPFDGLQGRLARSIIERLELLQPECICDIHNTSGTGPSFVIATADGTQTRVLAEKFCRRMIVTDFRLGSVMELKVGCPAITIECGGAQDSEADEVASQGLECIATEDDLFMQGNGSDMYDLPDELEVLFSPLRVELVPVATIAYEEEPSELADVSITPTIEHQNYGVTHQDYRLGWVGAGGLPSLSARDAAGQEQVHTLLREDNGWVYPAQNLRIFMATTNATIAATDCLFYAVPAN